MKNKNRIPTDGGPTKWTSPFAALKHAQQPAASPAYGEVSPESTKGPRLSSCEAPPAQPVRDQTAPVSDAPKKNRGRVDIIRQTAHRGGKTVTVVTGFVGISQAEKETLAKQMQKACGAGGTVKEGRIEIQGDQREMVARLLTEAGFRPVFAGG